MEVNLKAFIERMVDKYEDEKTNDKVSDYSSSLSDDEEEENDEKGVAELMFNDIGDGMPMNVDRQRIAIDKLSR